MSFEFIHDRAIADIAFRAQGKTVQELFQSCAQATIECLADVETVNAAKQLTFEKKEKTIERLLFEVIEEIIYLKDKDAIVFSDVSVEIDEDNKTATVTLHGDDIKPEEQDLLHDIKAVTMHYWRVEKTDEGWEANVVLDI